MRNGKKKTSAVSLTDAIRHPPIWAARRSMACRNVMLQPFTGDPILSVNGGGVAGASRCRPPDRYSPVARSQTFNSPGLLVIDPAAEASILPSGLKDTNVTAWDPRRVARSWPVAASQNLMVLS